MNYTREPLIQTVITPREGCKLLLRNSKRFQDQEDYFVDAVEVVSFGPAIFFRSLERPKPFLLPVTDYEVLELKETKMVLKAVTHEKAIKIGGGREPAKVGVKPQIVKAEQPTQHQPQQQQPQQPQHPQQNPQQPQQVTDKKILKRRSRRKKLQEHIAKEAEAKKQTLKDTHDEVKKGGDKDDETRIVSSSTVVPTLLAPPPILIKEKLNRLKNSALSQKPAEPEEKEKPVVEERKEISAQESEEF